MSPIQTALDLIHGNFGMIKSTLADFSDAEMMMRPVPGANHALWQLGHLAVVEATMIEHAGFNGALPQPPAGWADAFNAKSAANDDPKAFPPKAEIFAYYERVREAFTKWAQRLTEADLKRPSPEAFKSFAPTIAHLIEMTPAHACMHIGQWQVMRRKLGKPVLF